jgi:hypothetical protein
MGTLRDSQYLSGVQGAYRPIKNGGANHRSDAGDLDYSQFDKMMRGSSASLRPDKKQFRFRGYKDQIKVVETGASIKDVLFHGKYVYEFRTKRGELLGGMRYDLIDVWKEIEYDANRPDAGIKESLGARRARVAQDNPEWTTVQIDISLAEAEKRRKPVWKRKRVSLANVPFEKWGEMDHATGRRKKIRHGIDYNLGALKMHLSSHVPSDMQVSLVAKYEQFIHQKARKAEREARKAS